MSSQPPRRDDDWRDVWGQIEREFERPTPPERSASAERPVPQRMPPERPPMPRRTAPGGGRAVTVILVINVLMFAVSALLSGSLDPSTDALYLLGAKENAAIDAGQWWRLLTPMVLHGGLLHLLFNSWGLYALGPAVEALYGARRFVAIYVLAGLGGSIASYAFTTALSVGASGAIFGLMGALAARTITARRVIGPDATRMQLGQIGSLVAINLLFGLTARNIDNAAHIGGLIVGGLVGLVLAPRLRQASLFMNEPQRRDDGRAWVLTAAITAALMLVFIALRVT